MSLLIRITGNRAAGKTTLARELAGPDPYHVDGSGIANHEERLRDAPSDRNWIVQGERLQPADVEYLNCIVRSGLVFKNTAGRVTLVNAPARIIVDECNGH